jgi:hypothetical protein
MATQGIVRSLVAVPKAFDGSEDVYLNWKRSVKLYLRANRAQLSTDEDKYMVALLYMMEGKAALWANQIFDLIVDSKFGTSSRATPPVFTAHNLDEFWRQADEIFNPPNTRVDASIKLAKLEQGKKSTEEFFVEFNRLANLAGYGETHFDELKIRMADIQLNKALVMNIYNTDTLPTTWARYQERARILDRNWRAGQQARAGKMLHLLHATPSPAPKTQQYVPRPQPPPQQCQPLRDPFAMEVDVTWTANVANSTPSPRKTFSLDANGRVIGGRDQIMAAGACHYCKVPGHMIKACPELAAKDAQKGAYSPLQKPSTFVA